MKRTVEEEDLLEKLGQKIDERITEIATLKEKLALYENSVTTTLQPLNDPRKEGFCIHGWISYRSGEIGQASFYYPSNSNPRPSAGFPLCLNIHNAFQEPNSIPKCDNGNWSKTVFDDDKWQVLSYISSLEGTFITLMMAHHIEVDNGVGTHFNRPIHHPNGWVDVNGNEWFYDEKQACYVNDGTGERGHKYNFTPYASCVEQVKRDLLKPLEETTLKSKK